MEGVNGSRSGEPDAPVSGSGSDQEGPETATREALQQLMVAIGKLKTEEGREEQQIQIINNLQSSTPLMAAFFQMLQVFAMQQQSKKCDCVHGPEYQELLELRLEQQKLQQQLHLDKRKDALDKFKQEKDRQLLLIDQEFEKRRKELQEMLDKWESEA